MMDADYRYEEWKSMNFVIDRSDSMEEDVVRMPTPPKMIEGKVKMRESEPIQVDSWVDTYDKFLNQIFTEV